MRVQALAVLIVLALLAPVRADNDAQVKEIVDKAITAHGGADELKKLESTTVKMKGAIHTMGVDISFTGDAMNQGIDRHRVDLDAEVMGQKIKVINVFNKDKGWAKVNDDVKEFTKDQVDEAVHKSHAGSLSALLPLKDKAYTLSLVGEDKIDSTPVVVVRVSRKDRRDVTLSFDKKTHLLLKSETRVKDDATGMEVSEESFYSDYNEKGLRQPKKIEVKRDGKPFVEAEVTELRVGEKFDDSSFDKP